MDEVNEQLNVQATAQASVAPSAQPLTQTGIIDLWKKIIFNPDSFLADLPSLKVMLSFICVNYLIIAAVSLVNTWIIMDRIYSALGENLEFGVVIGEFAKWFLLGGVGFFVSLFIIDGLVYILSKAFGNKEENFISIFDVIYSTSAMGFLAPLSTVFIATGVNLNFSELGPSIIIASITIIIAGIFSVYLGYLVIAGLKKVCNISPLRASAALVIALFSYALIVWVVFRPDILIQKSMNYDDGRDDRCDLTLDYDPDCVYNEVYD